LKEEAGLGELRRVFDAKRCLNRMPNRFIAIDPDGRHLNSHGEDGHRGSLSTAADAVVATGRRSLIR
jgi:hypothetical protein